MASSLTVFIFEKPYRRLNEAPIKTALLEVFVGDVVQPWIEGVGRNTVISEPVTVTQIIQNQTGYFFVDETGKTWSASAIALGLSDEQKSRIARMGGIYQLSDNMRDITVAWNTITPSLLDC